MNAKRIIKLSNIIGVISIVLLIYWVFIFCSVEVFGLKVFKRNLTEIFYVSVLGILALMFGALMINIMFNLTRIADRHNADDSYKNKNVKRVIIGFVISFPIIFGLLVAGDYYTARKKENMMIKAAEMIIDQNQSKSNKIADYSFSLEWLRNTNNDLAQFSQIDRNFPSVSVLVKDTFENTDLYLEFNGYIYFREDTIVPSKQSFVKATTQVERDYLSEVFEKKIYEKRFSKYRGHYELFYPHSYNGKTVVFYFSEYQQYGK